MIHFYALRNPLYSANVVKVQTSASETVTSAHVTCENKHEWADFGFCEETFELPVWQVKLFSGKLMIIKLKSNQERWQSSSSHLHESCLCRERMTDKLVAWGWRRRVVQLMMFACVVQLWGIFAEVTEFLWFWGIENYKHARSGNADVHEVISLFDTFEFSCPRFHRAGRAAGRRLLPWRVLLQLPVWVLEAALLDACTQRPMLCIFIRQ